MTAQPPIVCKPTPWFLLRAAVMLAMFTLFAVWFYRDGSTGYREQNRIYYLHAAFKDANKEFSKQYNDGDLTPEGWRAYAEQQSVKVPDDPYVLPADFKQPMPWPAILHDYEKMKPLQWNNLWNEYTLGLKMDSKVPEHAHNHGAIREQWIVSGICLALALVAAFFLIRTMRRSIVAGADALTSQKGITVPYTEMNRLDLRKWDTKGLAFIHHDGPAGKGTLRIDGLTYGGFNKENGEPAEQLMKFVRSKFSGEVIEFVSADEPSEENADENPQTPT